MKATVFATPVAEGQDNGQDITQQTTPKQDKGHEKGIKKARKGHEKVLKAIQDDPSISIPSLAEACECSVKAVRTILDSLKTDGIIQHVGPAKGGHWEIIKPQSQNNSSEEMN